MRNLSTMFFSILFIILYFFRQIVGYLAPDNLYYFVVGNFDIFYLFSIISICKIIKKKKMDKRDYSFIVIIFLQVILQLLFIKELNIIKVVINATKIIVCFFVYLYFKENFNKIKIKNICEIYGILCYIFIICALFLPNSVLWRNNDYVNSYDLKRLQLFYTEPSELGLHSSIILIISVYLLIKMKNRTDKVKILTLSVIPVLLSLYFSKSMGGIAIGGVSILTMIIYYIHNSNVDTIKKVYVYLSIVLFFIALFPIVNNTGIYKRFIATFTTIDYSNNYRIFVASKVAYHSLSDNCGVGVGLGNVEIDSNVDKYRIYGLSSAGVINSYMNYITEGGILSIMIILYIICKIIKKSIEERSSLKLGLSIFIILFQFTGTYFTNPLCWIIYAIILGYKENIDDELVDNILAKLKKKKC